MSKKSSTNTTTDQQTHQIVTPTNPSFVTNGLAGLGGNISDLNNADPYSFIAPANDLQNSAGAGANDLLNTGLASHNLRSGLDATANVMNSPTYFSSAASAAPYLNTYMSPYVSDVVRNSLKGFDQNANLTRQQQNLDLAGDSTFGGSGGAIEKALTEGQLGLARGQLQSGLLNQGYTQALQYANEDANRAQGVNNLNAQLYGQNADRTLAAAQQLGDLSNNYDANQRANVALAGTVGDQLRQIQQAHDLAPLSGNAALASIWGSLPLGLLHGETQDGTEHGTQNSTTTVSDPLGTAGSLAMGLGSLLSVPLTSGASLGFLGGAGGIGGLGAFAGGAPTIGGKLFSAFGGH